ncbi:phytanoyl-CoA dioxygenase [Xylariales sp. PMI_506]|nr:phytanoyl-CoA dioxygenase [Xylariales sp. PMI_506]
MAASPLLESLERDGFVVLSGAVSGVQLERLRSAAQSATALAREGKWADVRTLPKQFPPWNVAEAADKGIWGVQGVMHPDMPMHDEFTKMYFSDVILKPTKELLQCSDDDLVMELFNLLVRPDRDFELRWHRDDIPATATAEEEMERLGQPAFSAQWNLALYDDASLVVIPGSHRRARTETEREAGPFEKVLPEQLIVQLKPGDVVFYNNNILHRGVYDSSIERMTLHGSCGHVDGAKARARNVLQHGLRNWIDKMSFDALEEEQRVQAEHMRSNLVQMGKTVGEVGYSLEG